MTFRSNEKYHDRAIYIDIEQTCWSTPPPLGMKPEIIEIGVVEVNLHTLEITREGSYFVRPKRWEISDRCTELTGITKEDIQKARPFPQVIESLKQEFRPSAVLCCSWGNDDDVIASTCHAHGLRTPLRYRLDLSRFFREWLLFRQTPSLMMVLDWFDLVFDGVPHGALADARNAARAHAVVVRRMRRKDDTVLPPLMEEFIQKPLVTAFGDKLNRAIGQFHFGEKPRRPKDKGESD